MFHEWVSRDREDGCATGQPQGVGPEAYLNSTSQGPTPEDARKDTHIRGRSRPFMKHAGQLHLYKHVLRDYLPVGKKIIGFPTVKTTKEISLAAENSAFGGKECQ